MNRRWLAEHRSEAALLIALAVSMAIAVIMAVVAFRAPAPFDPIEFNPNPRRVERFENVPNTDLAVAVVPVVPNYDGPGVRLGDTVPTTGERCSTHPVPLEVVASVYWERVDVRGQRVIVLDDAPATIEPGCIQLRFENPIPDGVAEIVEAEGPSQWAINGSATPVEEGGVPATFKIEPFWIVP